MIFLRNGRRIESIMRIILKLIILQEMKKSALKYSQIISFSIRIIEVFLIKSQIKPIIHYFKIYSTLQYL